MLSKIQGNAGGVGQVCRVGGNQCGKQIFVNGEFQDVAIASVAAVEDKKVVGTVNGDANRMIEEIGYQVQTISSESEECKGFINIELKHTNRVIGAATVGHEQIIAAEIHRNAARRVIFRVGGNVAIHITGAGDSVCGIGARRSED